MISDHEVNAGVSMMQPCCYDTQEEDISFTFTGTIPDLEGKLLGGAWLQRPI
jgi:hypothetical protein